MMKKKKLLTAAVLTMLLSFMLALPVMAAKGVASIDGQSYDDLETALNSAKNGQVVMLKKNVKLSKPVTVKRSGKEFTLNLNGHAVTLDGSAKFDIKKGSVIVGNGTIQNNNPDGEALNFAVGKGAGLTITGGTYKGSIWSEGDVTIQDGRFSVCKKETDIKFYLIKNEGTMTISGGKFDSKKCANLINNKTMTVNGGTFVNDIPIREDGTENDSGALVENGMPGAKKAKLTINGGTFKTSVVGVFNSGLGTVDIKNSKITCGNFGVFLNFGKLTVQDGVYKITGGWGIGYNRGEGQMEVLDGDFQTEWTVFENSDSGKITIKGGTYKAVSKLMDMPMLLAFSGNLTVKGGTFTGKNSWGYWMDDNPDVKVKISGATFKTKQKRKTGPLFPEE